jgi:hypothetical protein
MSIERNNLRITSLTRPWNCKDLTLEAELFMEIREARSLIINSWEMEVDRFRFRLILDHHPPDLVLDLCVNEEAGPIPGSQVDDIDGNRARNPVSVPRQILSRPCPGNPYSQRYQMVKYPTNSLQSSTQLHWRRFCCCILAHHVRSHCIIQFCDVRQSASNRVIDQKAKSALQ